MLATLGMQLLNPWTLPLAVGDSWAVLAMTVPVQEGWLPPAQPATCRLAARPAPLLLALATPNDPTATHPALPTPTLPNPYTTQPYDKCPPTHRQILDDLVDGWAADIHTEERVQFIHLLQKFSTDKHLRVTILSGECVSSALRAGALLAPNLPF